MERFSYRYTFSKRAQRLYEDYAEVKAWFDELKVLRSGRTAYDYVDMFAGFVESCGKSPKELVNLSPDKSYEVLERN